MQTIRGRLAVYYAVAMVATLGTFAAAIYFVERPTSHRGIDEELGARAQLIDRILAQAYRTQDSIVELNAFTGETELNQDLAQVLAGLPGYVLVLSRDGTPLFFGSEERADTTPGVSVQVLAESPLIIDQFVTAVMEESVEGGIGSVALGPPFGVVRYFLRPVNDAGPVINAVASGVSMADLVLRPQRLLLVMLLVAPLVITASTFIAYALAGRTLQPVTSIVDEVEAITDGRSLHRRLAAPVSRDEVSRLIRTLNEMLSRLETSFGALRRFTADASHELKTPLTVFRSGIERAMTHPQVSPEVLGVLEEALVEQKRMTELVDSLLTLARADEGRAPLVVERADLADILNEIAETAGLLGEQSGVDVTVHMPRRPQVLSVDRGRIRQLLMNLLTNAIKYTPAGGSVTVEPVLKRHEVLIKVADTGVGIAPGELPHVFDRFWRSDPARRRSGVRGGTGLGLAICKWIAEAHGGSIRVQSRKNQGTTMTVALPLEG
jgi:signal transduction histidine kinase